MVFANILTYPRPGTSNEYLTPHITKFPDTSTELKKKNKECDLISNHYQFYLCIRISLNIFPWCHIHHLKTIVLSIPTVEKYGKTLNNYTHNSMFAKNEKKFHYKYGIYMYIYI